MIKPNGGNFFISFGKYRYVMKSLSAFINYLILLQPNQAITSNGNIRTTTSATTKSQIPVTATILVEESSSPAKSKLLNVKRNSMYSIPPPNYHFDPQRSSEKLL